MLDISFTGGSVEVSAPYIGATSITEFSDEGTPVETNEIEVTGSAVTLNGTLVRWRKPVAYTVALTVIPGSDNDEALHTLLEASHVRPSDSGVVAIDVSQLVTSLTISCPAINQSGVSANRKYSYTNGCIVAGPSGPSANAEGKMSSRTYTFVFEQMTHSNDGGIALVAGAQTL